MMLKRVKVQAFEERLYCDCGGEMLACGEYRPMVEPTFAHRCVRCDKGVWIPGGSCPRIVFLPEDSPQMETILR